MTNNVINILCDMYKEFNQLSQEDKLKFTEKLEAQNNPFGKAFRRIMENEKHLQSTNINKGKF